jgi:hypothetical protein
MLDLGATMDAWCNTPHFFGGGCGFEVIESGRSSDTSRGVVGVDNVWNTGV